MNPIVADSSTLILLAKAGILKRAIKKEVFIPEQVYNEVVVKGKERSRKDSFEVEEMVVQKMIVVEETSEKEREKVERMFGLKAGERDALGLALKKKAIFLTDDRKARSAANALDVETMSALSVLLSLYQERKLSLQEALGALDILDEFGWYNRELIKQVFKKMTGGKDGRN